MICTFCNSHNTKHLDANGVFGILLKLSKNDRTNLVRWILDYGDSKFHSDVAELQLKNFVCLKCGELLEREDDGDRYYYICPNMECDSYK